MKIMEKFMNIIRNILDILTSIKVRIAKPRKSERSQNI